MMATLIEKEPNKLIKKKLPKYELGNLKKEERTKPYAIFRTGGLKQKQSQNGAWN